MKKNEIVYFCPMLNLRIKNTLPILILASLALIWGTSFILIKKGLLYFSAVEPGAIRIVIAALVFVPFAWRKTPKPNRKNRQFPAIVGIVGSAIPAYYFVKCKCLSTYEPFL